MTQCEKKKLQADFLKTAGPNATTFKAMMDCLPDVGFYMKDSDGRIMALNRRNCDICNIRDEVDAVGQRSDNIFPHALAEAYIANDAKVRKTRRPTINLRDQEGRLIGTACIYYKVPSVDGTPDWHGRLKPATEYIAAHYAEDITLDQLAQLVGTSSVNFRRQFTRTFGISPGRYITTIRLNAARMLLTTTEKSVADIAVEVGFFDQSHFIKAFKRERGTTPGRYRRQFWKG